MFQLTGIKVQHILDIRNLIISANQTTCIVGESGSGKTTLLKLLNKMISPDEGSLVFNEKDIGEMNSMDLRRKVVMLPQNPAIFDGSVKDNLLIGLHFSEKPPASDDRLKDILKMVHLNKSLEDSADKLSGGEKQRLALGRVLLMEPEVFLLDEPSSALDEDTEKLIIEQLVQHSGTTGKTLIMVTHSKEIAQNYADHIIELKNGQVANRVYSKNENAFFEESFAFNPSE